MRVDLLPPTETQLEPAVKEKQYWVKVVRHLHVESRLPLWDDRFELWLYENYQIKTLHESVKWPTHITGYEIDDAAATMLRLKYAN